MKNKTKHTHQNTWLVHIRFVCNFGLDRNYESTQNKMLSDSPLQVFKRVAMTDKSLKDHYKMLYLIWNT
jgi:hypothetical protein